MKKNIKKNKRKKGFTLIELLAVILILGIIALIAVPQVTNVISNADKGATETSAEHYVSAVNNQAALNKLDMDSENDIKDGIVDISTIDVNMTGEKPTSGNVYVHNGTVVEAEIEVKGKNVICDKQGKCTVIDKYVYYYNVLAKGATLPKVDTISISDTTDTRPDSNIYIRFALAGNKLFNPQVCGYSANKEVCLSPNEYEVSKDKIFKRFDYNSSTWTYNTGDQYWHNPANTYLCYLTEIGTACQTTNYQVNAVNDTVNAVNTNHVLCSVYDDVAGCKSQK